MISLLSDENPPDNQKIVTRLLLLTSMKTEWWKSLLKPWEDHKDPSGSVLTTAGIVQTLRRHWTCTGQAPSFPAVQQPSANTVYRSAPSNLSVLTAGCLLTSGTLSCWSEAGREVVVVKYITVVLLRLSLVLCYQIQNGHTWEKSTKAPQGIP